MSLAAGTAVPSRADDDREADRFAATSVWLVAASSIGALVACCVGLWLRSQKSMPLDDLIATSYPDYPKQIDMWVVAIWAAVTAVLGAPAVLRAGAPTSALSAGRWVSAHPGTMVAVFAAGLPVMPWLLSPLYTSVRQRVLASLMIAMMLLTVLLAWWIGRWRQRDAAQTMSLAGVTFAGLLGAATPVLVLLPKIAPGFDPPLGWAAVALCAVTLGIVTWASAHTARMARTADVAQIPIPALTFILIAPLGSTNTRAWWLLVTGIVGVCMLYVGRWARRRSRSAGVEVLPISGVVIAGYLAGLQWLPLGVATPDEYHWGELLVGWEELVTFGRAPFVDYVPAPGLNGFVYGAVNQALAGNAFTFVRAAQIVVVLAVVLTAVMVIRLVGARWGLLLAPAVAALAGPALGDRYVAVGLAAAVLAQPRLFARPLAWLGVWLISVPAVLLFMPTTGTAFVVATAPFAALSGWRARRTPRVALDWGILVAGVVLFAVSLPLLLALVGYVGSQGSRNNAAWGIPLLPTLTGTESLRFPITQIVRSAGWWFAVPVLVALASVAIRARHRLTALTATCIVLFLAALTPYAYGRIGPYELDRTGLATVVILGLALPVLMLRTSRITGALGLILVRGSALFVVAATGSAALVLMTGVQPLRVLAAPVLDGGQLGMPQLGAGPVAQADSLRARSTILAQAGGQDGAFLDLSNGTALYFFTGRPLPGPIAASFNMIGLPEQQKIVDAIEQDPPQVVFLSASDPLAPPMWDPQLRPYLVQRWLWERGYRAYVHSGIPVLLSPQAAARVGPDFMPLTGPQADALLIGKGDRLAAQYALWGRNEAALQPLFDSVPTQMADGTLSWDTGDPDFLAVDLTCSAGGGLGSISWPGGQITLPLRPGPSLVPLGAYPSWYDRTEDLLTVTPAPGCELSSARLARLR